MQHVLGIHTRSAPDGTPLDLVARFRSGFKGQTLASLGGAEAPPAGATVAVTSESSALRAVAFPFSDPKKAAQVAPFEVEGQVPFDIDDAVVSTEPLGATPTGTRLLVAVAPRDHVAALIAAHAAGDQPQVILPEAFALFAFARRLALPAPTLVVDARPGRALLVAVAGGAWEGTRRVTAEWDPASGPGLPAAAVSALRRAAQSLALDGGVRPERVVLTGTAAGPETLEAVAKALGLAPLALSEAAAGLSDVGAERADPGALALHAVAMGAALAALDGRRRINLRSGPFSLVSQGEGRLVKRVAGVGLGVLLVLGVAWVDGSVRMHAANVRLDAAKDRLEAQYRSVFPDAGRVVDPVVQAGNALKALTARTQLFGGSGGVTALGVLDAVSRAIPKDLTLDVLELSIEGNRLRMEAEAASFDAIDQVKAHLAALPGFTDVRVSDAKASAKENRVKFRVSVTLAEGI
jgi:general secretion pathway protein L